MDMQIVNGLIRTHMLVPVTINVEEFKRIYYAYTWREALKRMKLSHGLAFKIKKLLNLSKKQGRSFKNDPHAEPKPE